MRETKQLLSNIYKSIDKCQTILAQKETCSWSWQGRCLRRTQIGIMPVFCKERNCEQAGKKGY